MNNVLKRALTYFYFLPVSFRAYQAECSRYEFIRALRTRTRNQYPEEDGPKLRALSEPEMLVRNEYDNIIFLKDSETSRINPTTCMIILQREGGARIFTLSYAGGAGIIYMAGSYFLSLYTLLSFFKTQHDFQFLAVTIGLYSFYWLLIHFNIYRQRKLIAEVVKECRLSKDGSSYSNFRS